MSGISSKPQNEACQMAAPELLPCSLSKGHGALHRKQSGFATLGRAWDSEPGNLASCRARPCTRCGTFGRSWKSPPPPRCISHVTPVDSLCWFLSLETIASGASQAVEWLRLLPAMKRTWVWSLVREVRCPHATGRLRPWAATRDPVRCSSGLTQPNK